MTLQLVDAMTLRDGGTTCVSLRTPYQNVITYTLDYALPLNGRARYITRTCGDISEKLPIGGAQEQRACEEVRALLVAQCTESTVAKFLSGQIENPGEEHWFYAFNFLRLCNQEGKLDGHGTT